MSKALVGKFLPLGSMLKLIGTEDDSLLYFVVARAIKENEAAEIVPRYKVAPHPYGDIPTKAVFSIESTQIIEVLFEAYEDEQDKTLLDDLIYQITHAPKQAVKQETEIGKVDKPSEVNERELLIQDPFYKFRKKR